MDGWNGWSIGRIPRAPAQASTRVPRQINMYVLGALFKRVILMSGSWLNDWAVVMQPYASTMQLADGLHCSLPADVSADTILECLRNVPLRNLLKIPAHPQGDFNAFGPNIDKVTISEEIILNIDKVHQRLAYYDVMFGVTNAEALLMFGENNLQRGFSDVIRNHLIEEYVKSTYDYHQSEIMAAIISEYTEWENTPTSVTNVRDSTLNVITDAYYVAPATELGRLFTTASVNNYFYVFNHHSKISQDYSQVSTPPSQKYIAVSKYGI